MLRWSGAVLRDTLQEIPFGEQDLDPKAKDEAITATFAIKTHAHARTHNNNNNNNDNNDKTINKGFNLFFPLSS